MTRSVEELKRESERNRLALAATTERLREQLGQTAEDIRRTVSPQHVKSEVSDYISDKTQNWLDALKRQAMENPLQAMAAGTAVAVPVLRLARAFPLPLLMMGAGLALTSKSVRTRASEAAAASVNRAREALNPALDQTQSITSNVKDGLSSAQDRATGMFADVRDRAGNLTSDVTGRVADTARTAADNVNGTLDQLHESASRAVGGARNYVAAAPDKARGLIGDNAVLVGALGIAIGAVIAAALPKTEVEANAMGDASDGVKRAAQDATHAGLDTIRATARSATEAAQTSVADADLGAHATRMTQNLADTVKDAAEDAVSAALNPSGTANN